MPNLDALLAREFLVEQHCLYLNHAAVAPWPACTARAVQDFAHQCLEGGARHYPAWEQAEQGLRERVQFNNSEVMFIEESLSDIPGLTIHHSYGNYILFDAQGAGVGLGATLSW